MDLLPRPTTGQPMERLFDSNLRGGLEVWALIIDSVKNLLNAEGQIENQIEGGF
jgi:hypothetical protein